MLIWNENGSGGSGDWICILFWHVPLKLSAAAVFFFFACLYFFYICFFPSLCLVFDSMSSNVLASLADDVIPIDTGAARWESRTFLAWMPHEYMDAGLGIGQDEHTLALSWYSRPVLTFSLPLSLSPSLQSEHTADVGAHLGHRHRRGQEVAARFSLFSGAFVCRASFICMLPSVHVMD